MRQRLPAITSVTAGYDPCPAPVRGGRRATGVQEPRTVLRGGRQRHVGPSLRTPLLAPLSAIPSQPLTATMTTSPTAWSAATLSCLTSTKSTGQLSVAEGASLDFESKSTYSVSARAMDDGGRLDNITVSIRVTDVDEAGMIELPAEAPELGSELTVALMDPDGT